MSEELMVPFQGAMDRPKALTPGDLTGTEGIGLDDIRLQRLAIAQGLSEQINPESSSHVDGLKLFDMFNDLTGEIYGRGPMTFVPIRRDVRCIEFKPRSEGGGVVDLNVPLNDPRTLWTTNADGERQPPRATRYVEFVVLLLRPGVRPELVVLSIKETNKFNRRAAEQLTMFIIQRQAPIYAGVYTLSSKSEKNDSGTFGVYVVKNAGWVPVDAPDGAKLFQYCKTTHESLAGKVIIVEREPGDEPTEAEATSFNTSRM